MNRLSSVLAACAAGAVLTLGVAGGMATAQTKPGAEKGSAPTKAGKFHGRFGNKLGLTDQQIAQIREIKAQARERAKQIWANDSQTVGALKNQLKTLHEETKSKVDAVLTAEQRAKMKDVRDKFGAFRGRFKGTGKGQTVPPPSAKA